MDQIDMFGHESKRRKIKDTQRESWKEIRKDLSARHNQVLELLDRSKKGLTLFETCAFYGLPPNQFSGRFTELAEQDRIIDTGLRRINPMTGKKGVVWDFPKKGATNEN